MRRSKLFFERGNDHSPLLEFSRERLTEIHDEYEEREQRWTRIANLLNRDDFTTFNCSTSSSTSVTYRGKDSPCLRM